MLTTRKMTLEDVDRIYEIEVQSFKTPWTKEAFHNEIVSNTLAEYIVLLYDAHIIGYGGMWLIMDEIHITNVALATDYRGKGYSKVLISALIQFGVESRFNHMTLEVRESNLVAIALYEQFGFVSVGKRPKYYIDTGEDALVMWKELK